MIRHPLHMHVSGSADLSPLRVCETVQYDRVVPESSFIAVVSLFAAHVTYAIRGAISFAQLTQR